MNYTKLNKKYFIFLKNYNFLKNLRLFGQIYKKINFNKQKAIKNIVK